MGLFRSKPPPPPKRGSFLSNLIGIVLAVIVLAALLNASHKVNLSGIGKTLSKDASQLDVHKSIHSGTLDCTQLEELWRAGGGTSSTAFMAAEIAMAESGGEQYARDPRSGTYPSGYVDYGYWQIDTQNGGSDASYDPLTNAKQAVGLYKKDGWEPWITWRHGAEVGKCPGG